MELEATLEVALGWLQDVERSLSGALDRSAGRGPRICLVKERRSREGIRGHERRDRSRLQE